MRPVDDERGSYKRTTLEVFLNIAHKDDHSGKITSQKTLFSYITATGFPAHIHGSHDIRIVHVALSFLSQPSAVVIL